MTSKKEIAQEALLMAQAQRDYGKAIATLSALRSQKQQGVCNDWVQFFAAYAQASAAARRLSDLWQAVAARMDRLAVDACRDEG